MSFRREFAAFVWKEMQSAVFAFAIFGLLVIAKFLLIPGLPRYDFVLLGCIGVQAWMILRKMESWAELAVVAGFHILGFALEVHKTRLGAWAYPEFAYTKFAGVPLYSGFMYSAIGSYIARAFRRFHLEIEHPPHTALAVALGFAIYTNFYTDSQFFDFRWLLMGAVIVLYGRTSVRFLCAQQWIKMPLSLSFLCIGFFVWVAENIASAFRAYRYPYQEAGWRIVHGSKVGSWFLLIILAYVAVEWVWQRQHVEPSADRALGQNESDELAARGSSTVGPPTAE